MNSSQKLDAKAAANRSEVIEFERSSRASAGPAGGLLIAVGCSLLLWAVIAEAARFATAFFF